MAEYVFTLRNVRKAHGDKVVLDNVTLSFLHGAKIGVVGPNGAGKSTLFKIMAGLEHANNGDAIRDPEATVGMLQQEPPLTEGKTVLENVEEAVSELKGKMKRLEEAYMEMGEPDADQDALMKETGDLQTGVRGAITPGDTERTGTVDLLDRRVKLFRDGVCHGMLREARESVAGVVSGNPPA
jgi:ATPase subunit of ABC transporter with duplicated ATPase domains